MWRKNLTPAGLASYLLANYGYNKIMQLAGGSIERGKENLAEGLSVFVGLLVTECLILCEAESTSVKILFELNVYVRGIPRCTCTVGDS